MVINKDIVLMDDVQCGTRISHPVIQIVWIMMSISVELGDSQSYES